MSLTLIPPHPISKIHHRLLSKYEKSDDWIAQPKFNGQRNVIHVVNGEVYFRNRHGEEHKNYIITKEIKEKLLSISDGEECVFDSELMHNKSSLVKNVIMLFDIFFFKKRLTEIDQETRLRLLQDLCNDKIPSTNGINLQNNQVYVSEKYDNDFGSFFQKIVKVDYLEGLVLRKKNSKFLWQILKNDVSWLVRVRKEHKNYNF